MEERMMKMISERIVLLTSNPKIKRKMVSIANEQTIDDAIDWIYKLAIATLYGGV